jgi:prepilin-type N-terminal cleavage/methylation domain-containing protein
MIRRILNPARSLVCRSARRPDAGFTLLEVMVAIAIFAVSTLALVVAFRTATKSFVSGRRTTETMQTLRFVVEHISRDLRAVYYDTDYNKRFNDMQFEMASKEQELIQQLKDESGKRDRAEKGEPGFLGLRLNLQFIGEGTAGGGGGTARAGKAAPRPPQPVQPGESGATGKTSGAYIEFAHFTPSDGTFDESSWGTERVRYYVENGNLYRQRSPVPRILRLNPNLEQEIEDAQNRRTEKQQRRSGGRRGGGDDTDPYGGISFDNIARKGLLPQELRNQLVKVNYVVEVEPEPLPPDLLAERVVEFNVKFGYFSGGEGNSGGGATGTGNWTETTRWDSDEKALRSPKFEVDPMDPMFMQKLNAYQERASDNLPACVKLTLGVEVPDEKRQRKGQKPRVERVETVIWLPAALEVFTPGDDLFFQSFPNADGSFGPQTPGTGQTGTGTFGSGQSGLRQRGTGR